MLVDRVQTSGHIVYLVRESTDSQCELLGNTVHLERSWVIIYTGQESLCPYYQLGDSMHPEELLGETVYVVRDLGSYRTLYTQALGS